MGTLGTVISFEIRRTLRRRSFWLTALLFPILIVVIGVIMNVTSQSASTDQSQEADFSFEYADPASLIDPALVTTLHGTLVTDAATGLADVKAGRVDAFFNYPADPTKTAIEVAGQDVGLFNSGKYEAVARALLTKSAETRINSARDLGIVTGGYLLNSATYKDGQPTNGIGAAVAPALLAVMFFLLVVLMGNQMLSAFIDEKENRVAEISLTTMNAGTMLVGKVVSLLVLGFIQMIIVALVPAFMIATGRLGTLADFGQITVDPATMAIGILLLIGGFALNMTSVVTVGMIMPSARDANSMFAPIMLFTVIPLYLSGMFVTNPDATIVQVVTFFPWSAAITTLVRNAVGTLPLWQAAIVIVEQFVIAGVVLWFANKISRFGLISYDKALDVRAILAHKNAR